MSKNKTLSDAKSAKKDEFYTQYADIAREMEAYLDYDADAFRGQTVLLPCDDPEWSNFTRYFAENFERLGLKKLISTSYAFDAKKISAAYLPGFESLTTEAIRRSPKFDRKKERKRGKIFVLDEDTNKSGRIDIDDLKWEYLEGDGDFRSEEVRRLRDEADVIVTNPPFSLFREFLAWILEGENLAQSRRDAEGSLDRINRIDRIDGIEGDGFGRGDRENVEKEGEGFLDRINRIDRIDGIRQNCPRITRIEEEVGRARPPDAPPHERDAGGGSGTHTSSDLASQGELRSGDIRPTARPPKKFAIIGNRNAITYKEVFPLVKENKIWLDNPFVRGAGYFKSPMEVDKSLSYYNSHDYREGLIRVPGVRWFTNMELGRRHEPLNLLTMRDNIKYSRHKEVKGVGYQHYDNYDAIEVPYTDAIPSDYDGVMGVPISFLDKYCPEQFEIVGVAKAGAGDPALKTKIYPEQIQVAKNGQETKVTKLNDGPVLKILMPPEGELYYKVGNELFVQTYARILIRRRKP